MRYNSELTAEEIRNNRILAEERTELFKKEGMDIRKNREFIMERAGLTPGNILEIGSGRGNMAVFLAANGHRFTSIDRDSEMLRSTALNLAAESLLDKADLRQMDAYAMDFEDGSFNSIIMADALHHMNDFGGLFREIDRVLKPGGVILIGDFNEKGMEIIGNIHQREKRVHESSSAGRKDAVSWFDRRGYHLESWDDICHWMIRGVKS